ncbi:fumarylacetoacetate hydrolase family protein [Alkalicoccobacillus plakortidis]|uniref:Fumarylacetoacetate hydrolase family protein n=1 Tax=Alkalicoccobacillus plakortidis TaxID=444060 RepID=A0ABT0XK90_9BACI|nr:fumarylacetoacetate hydrolase family protein [Alkalicoccobacillus plakortidis]MCM2676252.1 fumarylacetoacetate hydrolase family protein [Alkalicoccobacillus plakortidis]
MKICTIQKNNEFSLGLYHNEKLIDIAEALHDHPKAGIPKTVDELCKDFRGSLSLIQDYLNSLKDLEPYQLSEEHSSFGPVVSNPEKIICVGLNYRRHADETGATYPEVPILFNKFNNTLTGHKHEIVIPDVTKQLDYEVELAIVIGKTAKQVSEDEALDYVFGYTVANDLSARDLQMKTPQWLLGKTCDDFNPIGPYLVTSDEIDDPQSLSLQTTVNGEIRQDSNTSDMIFSCKEIISHISHHFTLKPGDVILTGTPEGVVLGLPKEERVYLQEGDSVSVSIEKVGTLTNTFIKE